LSPSRIKGWSSAMMMRFIMAAYLGIKNGVDSKSQVYFHYFSNAISKRVNTRLTDDSATFTVY